MRQVDEQMAPSSPSDGIGSPGFRVGDLDRYLKREIPGLKGALEIEQIAGGQSNPTFFVSYPGRRLVLRKRPAGNVLPSAHAIDREYRIISALAHSGVAVPKALLYCERIDLVGTPFYVMDRLDGRVFHDTRLAEVPAGERKAIYFAYAEMLARLHRCDWQPMGLSDYGRPGSYFARQIARWAGQWKLSKTQHIPDIDWIIDWLQQNIPPDTATTIVHGDYRLGNVMFHPTEPRVIAVLDWELSTLGNPLADVAHSSMIWHSMPDEYGGLAGIDLMSEGLPSEAEYVGAYYAAGGTAGELAPFHMAFALFRFAVILEGIAARVLGGNAVGTNAASVGALSAKFARRAVEVATCTPHVKA